MPWHVTERSNVESVLRDGLIPAVGERSSRIGETDPAVHLFSSLADFESASWLESELDEDETYAIFHVSIEPDHGSAWTEVRSVIPPNLITLISLDIDEFVPSGEHAAMDSIFSMRDEIAP